MKRLCEIVAAAGVLALLTMAPAAQAATVYTQTFTLTNDQNGGSVATSVISGSWGVKFYSTGRDVIFSNVQVSANDQGQTFTYDFSYNCVTGSAGCTSNPKVPSQYPGASGFDVSYTVNTGELPPCALPKLGQTTSCEGDVHTSFNDFIFDSSGLGHLKETNSFVNVVPEPAEWALMLFGLASIGAALRLRPVPARA